MPGRVLGAGFTLVNQTDVAPALMGLATELGEILVPLFGSFSEFQCVVI